MFDEDTLSDMSLLCLWLDVRWSRGHSQNHCCADFHLNMEEVVPDVFKIHILLNKAKIIRQAALQQYTNALSKLRLTGTLK